jgi:hypothetical protein
MLNEFTKDEIETYSCQGCKCQWCVNPTCPCNANAPCNFPVTKCDDYVTDQASMDVIKFTGQILDGYNGHTVSVVIVDLGTELRVYHAHGHYTAPKTIFNNPFGV